MTGRVKRYISPNTNAKNDTTRQYKNGIVFFGSYIVTSKSTYIILFFELLNNQNVLPEKNKKEETLKHTE